MFTEKLETDILIATSDGKVIRLGGKDVPILGRATQGVKLIKLGSHDIVSSVALLEDNLEQEDAETIAE